MTADPGSQCSEGVGLSDGLKGGQEVLRAVPHCGQPSATAVGHPGTAVPLSRTEVTFVGRSIKH